MEPFLIVFDWLTFEKTETRITSYLPFCPLSREALRLREIAVRLEYKSLEPRNQSLGAPFREGGKDEVRGNLCPGLGD